MTDQYIERVENLIRVVSSVRDEDFDLAKWCHCAIGHAVKDAYFIAQGLDSAFTDCEVGKSYMREIGEFFDIHAARASSLFIPNLNGGYGSRKQVLAALRVLLLEKMAQQIEVDIPISGVLIQPGQTLHVEELAEIDI